MNEQTQAHEASCPECGAPKANGLNCWEMLGMLIAWEYDDPELRAEHFLTVACYNLQHPAQFTDATLAGLRAVFIERLDQGLALPRFVAGSARPQLAQRECSSRSTSASRCCVNGR